jgi:hypothetical protein
MAGLDYMFDACGFIQRYIKKTIRKLLERETNQYQDPNWVQAAELFRRVVVPCEEFSKEYFIQLAEDIIKIAEQHNYLVVYRGISGMYNKAIVKEDDSVEYLEDLDVMHYESLFQPIKNWIGIK